MHAICGTPGRNRASSSLPLCACAPPRQAPCGQPACRCSAYCGTPAWPCHSPSCSPERRSAMHVSCRPHTLRSATPVCVSSLGFTDCLLQRIGFGGEDSLEIVCLLGGLDLEDKRALLGLLASSRLDGFGTQEKSQ